jgi:SAM-dependent methyltransferase
MTGYLLFDAFADRYDLHTPPGHYRHDHQLVLDVGADAARRCRMLDVGCGTGTLLEKAYARGFDVAGIDAAEKMIEVARRRLPEGAVRVERMQELNEHARYDLVTSLSWSIHYCSGEEELMDILRRMGDALVPGGMVLLQVAHAQNLTTDWLEDQEPGPAGDPGDVVLRYHFEADAAVAGRLYATYVYNCRSREEHFEERHVLSVANAPALARCGVAAGLTHVATWNSWRREPFSDSGAPWVVFRK